MDNIKEKLYPATINIITGNTDLQFLPKKCNRRSDYLYCQFLDGDGMRCKMFDVNIESLYHRDSNDFDRCAECLEKYPPLVECPNQDVYGHMPTCHICNERGWIRESELEEKKEQLRKAWKYNG